MTPVEAKEGLKRFGEAMEEVDTSKIQEAEERLLPCPFCGGRAIINFIPPHTHGATAWFMPDCQGEYFVECGCSLAIAGGPDLEKTVAAWNSRKPTEAGK
jgi:hypothetical protein